MVSPGRKAGSGLKLGVSRLTGEDDTRFSRPKSREWIETRPAERRRASAGVSPGRKAGSGLKPGGTVDARLIGVFLPAEKPGVD